MTSHQNIRIENFINTLIVTSMVSFAAFGMEGEFETNNPKKRKQPMTSAHAAKPETKRDDEDPSQGPQKRSRTDGTENGPPALVADILSEDEYVTQLIDAIKRSDEATVDSILKRAPYVVHHYHPKHKRKTAIHYAAKFGCLTILKSLQRLGANLDEPVNSDAQEQPIHLAARYGHREIIDYLITQNVHVGTKDRLGNTVLHYAARSNIARVLMRVHHLDQEQISTPNNLGNVPLHVACMFDESVDSVKFLIEQEPQHLMMSNQDGHIPLHMAVMHNASQVIRYFAEYHSGHFHQYVISLIDNQFNERAMQSPLNHDAMRVILSLIIEMQLDFEPKTLSCLLWYAVTLQDENFVNFLINKPSLSRNDHYEFKQLLRVREHTPCLFVALSEQPKIAKIVFKGIPSLMQDDCLKDPLLLAARSGDLGLFKYIWKRVKDQRSMDVAARKKLGVALFETAIDAGSLEMVDWIANNLQPQIVSKIEFSDTLSSALGHSDFHIIEYLVEKGYVTLTDILLNKDLFGDLESLEWLLTMVSTHLAPEEIVNAFGHAEQAIWDDDAGIDPTYFEEYTKKSLANLKDMRTVVNGPCAEFDRLVSTLSVDHPAYLCILKLLIALKHEEYATRLWHQLPPEKQVTFSHAVLKVAAASGTVAMLREIKRSLPFASRVDEECGVNMRLLWACISGNYDVAHAILEHAIAKERFITIDLHGPNDVVNEILKADNANLLEILLTPEKIAVFHRLRDLLGQARALQVDYRKERAGSTVTLNSRVWLNNFPFRFRSPMTTADMGNALPQEIKHEISGYILSRQPEVSDETTYCAGDLTLWKTAFDTHYQQHQYLRHKIPGSYRHKENATLSIGLSLGDHSFLEVDGTLSINGGTLLIEIDPVLLQTLHTVAQPLTVTIAAAREIVGNFSHVRILGGMLNRPMPQIQYLRNCIQVIFP